MPFRAGLHWSRPPAALADTVVGYGDAIGISVIEFAEVLAAQAEREAKRNAPWKDRTGKARQSLRAFADRNGSHQARVVLQHGVSYGIYLEVKHAGQWGIVLRTLQALAPQWHAFLRSLGF